ncbi:excalibur calcium-binding domain-containing protein [Kineococcus indalonis]|uniref:excalibur calcium-binding domain-containing protein n=1 Tax=Kineococcus indalonis TaxID=2696566 RepID=UPI001412E33A|nr:excalibur calcium-binding domain-containing protein [Kineococcus indalonis]NAZ86330.1 hypothetical protein [Kineococcus indalonis]
MSAAALLAGAGTAQATPYPGPNGTKDVRGAIEQEWLRLQAGTGFKPGAPLSDEAPTAGAVGAFNTFQNGVIYWSPGTGAHEVHGAFYGYWAGQGFERGPLGYPLTNEQPAAAGGVFQVFQGGTLYWSPATGAHKVSGSFYQLWASLGWERSFLGFPISEELPAAGGVFQRFQGGTLYWSPATGAHSVSGAFYSYWAARGWERGTLGYPTSQELVSANGVYQNFQGGTLTWTRAQGVVRQSKAFYANCTDVWNTIGSPLYAGQQGYSRDLDRDGDGVACEVDPR